jgi:hypothetical protein
MIGLIGALWRIESSENGILMEERIQFGRLAGGISVIGKIHRA